MSKNKEIYGDLYDSETEYYTYYDTEDIDLNYAVENLDSIMMMHNFYSINITRKKAELTTFRRYKNNTYGKR